jgi:hypothetical protein
MIMAEKLGISTDQLREALIEASNWDMIQNLTKDLRAKVELEAMKAQVKADITQDISQAVNQTANQTMETSSLTASEATSLTIPFVETVVVTARAANV